jgi:uncharacterized protein
VADPQPIDRLTPARRPAGRPMGYQRWRDLLFIHWTVPVEAVQRLVAPQLTVESFDGVAWVGLVPFDIYGSRPRWLPAVPGISDFPETNVRTYVHHKGSSPGVWFFSLDAANPVAVWAARRSFYLPYYHARMTVDELNGDFHYQSHRIHRGAQSATFAGRYRPTGPVYHATPETLDHWLTERYCLYAAAPSGYVYRGDIHHNRWPLQPAEADIDINTMAEPVGLRLPEIEPLLHFVSRINVVAWRLTAVV